LILLGGRLWLWRKFRCNHYLVDVGVVEDHVSIEVDHVVSAMRIETHRAESILALVAGKDDFLLFVAWHLTVGLMLVGWL